LPRPRLIVHLLALFFMGSAWGFNYALARITARGGANPLGLAFWLSFGGGITLGILCLVRWTGPRVTSHHMTYYVSSGMLGSVLPVTLYFYAASHVPAGVLAITGALIPLLTYALSALVRVDVFSIRRLTGLVFGFVAVLFIVTPGSSLPPPMLPRVLVSLLSSLCYAFQSIYMALRRPAGTDALALTTGMMLASSAIMLPLVLATNGEGPLAFPSGKIELPFAAMTVLSALAYVVYLYLVGDAGPVFASQSGYIVTVSGVLWGTVILNEHYSAWVWIALVSMLIGLTLVTLRPGQNAADKRHHEG